jgi:hypothetical protein
MLGIKPENEKEEQKELKDKEKLRSVYDIPIKE